MMTQRRTVLRNDFNKETFIFTEDDNPEVARFDVVLGKGGSGGGNALVHIHPVAEERFVVTSGLIKIVIEGREQLVGPGQDAIVAPGKRHYFINACDGDTHLPWNFGQRSSTCYSSPISRVSRPSTPSGILPKAIRIS